MRFSARFLLLALGVADVERKRQADGLGHRVTRGAVAVR